MLSGGSVPRWGRDAAGDSYERHRTGAVFNGTPEMRIRLSPLRGTVSRERDRFRAAALSRAGSAPTASTAMPPISTLRWYEAPAARRVLAVRVAARADRRAGAIPRRAVRRSTTVWPAASSTTMSLGSLWQSVERHHMSLPLVIVNDLRRSCPTLSVQSVAPLLVSRIDSCGFWPGAYVSLIASPPRPTIVARDARLRGAASRRRSPSALGVGIGGLRRVGVGVGVGVTGVGVLEAPEGRSPRPASSAGSDVGDLGSPQPRHGCAMSSHTIAATIASDARAAGRSADDGRPPGSAACGEVRRSCVQAKRGPSASRSARAATAPAGIVRAA